MAKDVRQLLSFAGILAGSSAVLAGLLVNYLSAVLATLLDVDNYLRTSPASATPRAKIVERYSALLHHLHTCREDDGRRSYDRIVIVAHSLGSLITADLFRFLRQRGEPDLTSFTFAGPESEAIPVYFFSMGCPLRQLLSRFFPHLYQWIRAIPEDTSKHPAPSDPKELIALDAPALRGRQSARILAVQFHLSRRSPALPHIPCAVRTSGAAFPKRVDKTQAFRHAVVPSARRPFERAARFPGRIAPPLIEHWS